MYSLIPLSLPEFRLRVSRSLRRVGFQMQKTNNKWNLYQVQETLTSSSEESISMTKKRDWNPLFQKIFDSTSKEMNQEPPRTENSGELEGITDKMWTWSDKKTKTKKFSNHVMWSWSFLLSFYPLTYLLEKRAYEKWIEFMKAYFSPFGFFRIPHVLY